MFYVTVGFQEVKMEVAIPLTGRAQNRETTGRGMTGRESFKRRGKRNGRKLCGFDSLYMCFSSIMFSVLWCKFYIHLMAYGLVDQSHQ